MALISNNYTIRAVGWRGWHLSLQDKEVTLSNFMVIDIIISHSHWHNRSLHYYQKRILYQYFILSWSKSESASYRKKSMLSIISLRTRTISSCRVCVTAPYYSQSRNYSCMFVRVKLVRKRM